VNEIAQLHEQHQKTLDEFEGLCVLKTRIQKEIDGVRLSVQKIDEEWADKVNSMNGHIAALRNEFASVLSRLNQDLGQTMIASDVAFARQAESHRQLHQQLALTHTKKVHELEDIIAREHRGCQQQNEKFMREKTKQAMRLERYTNDAEKGFLEARNEHERGCNAILLFYQERITVLTAKLEDFKRKCTEQPSRECDIALIEQLTMRLRTVKIQLGGVFTNLKQCRSLLVEQEHTYNRQFGHAPAVGILPSRIPH
jgi:hypothetical protein